MPDVPRRQAKHVRSVSNVQNRRSNGSNILPQDLQVHYHAGDRNSLNINPSHNLNLTQQQINAALFNSNSPTYSVQPIPSCSKNYSSELHMAEILVESAAHQQRSAFQFDTITPKKNLLTATPNNNDYNDAPLSSVMLDSGIEMTSGGAVMAEEQISKENITNELTIPTSADTEEEEEDYDEDVDSGLKTLDSSSSDDNGGFVTPEDQEKLQHVSKHRVKRATVVGNPMFSSSQDSELGPVEGSMGLDDLEMDYDQIMHYFDNLKESNA
ncbi:unnamed protein product [Diamesa hyperborea]